MPFSLLLSVCGSAALRHDKKVEGVQAACDRDSKTVTITAPDVDAARKALDALAAGGFHGDTGDKDLAMKNAEGVPAGKVKSLKISGAHNCCGLSSSQIERMRS